ncbi:MAG: hypothetical protein WKF86_00315 [Acidimicrobiales bacterium]
MLSLASGCGGDGEKAVPPDVTTTFLPTTTTIDPALREFLLVAADVPEFKEETTASPKAEEETFQVCQQADAPAAHGLIEEPDVDGATFVRGLEDAVKVSSSVTASTPGKAEAALDELTDAKISACYEADVLADVEKETPGASDITVKLTTTKSTVAGADQAALLSAAVSFKFDGKAESARSDFVLLRREGTIVSVFYSGPTNLTSTSERLRIVAAVSKKLGGDSSGTSTTSGSGSLSTSVVGRGSSTTSKGSSTTNKGSSTTRSTSTDSTSRTMTT